jgi:hypothetical protein
MELVDVEHLFGGERVVVYYLAEDRVDFRDLVKQLASEFQTRIEMRQIGVRDEAKLLADYGDCGKPVCCNTHLHEMPPVSMKMAKLQKATLDPTKISGRCGRLKCCLRYEYDTYEELQKTLPPAGSDIITSTGRARVLGQEILTQQLLVQMEDGRRLLIGVQEVLTVLKVGSGNVRRGRGRDTEDENLDEGQPTGEAGAADRRDSRGRNGGPNQRRDSRPPRDDRRGDRRDHSGHEHPRREELPENAPPPDPAASLPPDLPPTQVEQPDPTLTARPLEPPPDQPD